MKEGRNWKEGRKEGRNKCCMKLLTNPRMSLLMTILFQIGMLYYIEYFKGDYFILKHALTTEKKPPFSIETF
jgi:hypothetical protein